ncbi:MAG: 4-hydroxy-tetrahydrodipicolinate reductase [Acidimicrobiia bacterium]|nr:4-hydroxy-tetrahydrodipicolinate reductase [bacterium]MXX01523.1 4-hydroxy-tetrahydrodipicolinate reductase [Acidimicrobiia bacterium]MXX46365.1 4-hydroxy-tetrahydrodipicolinate reductase [Acidimicrobiia bacterium]MXY74633.1 4-hydroxy-tetrahydrodipicolinate reductase [Acidimicrobiia bacterium]MYA38009.1 4-hydroxy-tetrahydrodipicolinate reductase [Acidimicrobiia bacterium]
MTIRVGVAGALGRMGSLVAETVAEAPGMELVACYDLFEGEVAGIPVRVDVACLAEADVLVDFTNPEVVMDNLVQYRDMDCHAVVGTSGFTAERIASVRGLWGEEHGPNCLIVPNFSIGAVLMMRFAAFAAGFFSASEVIELHHDQKADAPSGTAVSTALGMAETGGQSRQVSSAELYSGALGARVEGVPVHSVRLPGLLAHQEVLFGNPGEILTIRHDSTDRVSFLPGVMLAVLGVSDLESGVSVGLDVLLDA